MPPEEQLMELRASVGVLVDGAWTAYSESIKAGFEPEQAMRVALAWMQKVIQVGAES